MWPVSARHQNTHSHTGALVAHSTFGLAHTTTTGPSMMVVPHGEPLLVNFNPPVFDIYTVRLHHRAVLKSVLYGIHTIIAYTRLFRALAHNRRALGLCTVLGGESHGTFRVRLHTSSGEGVGEAGKDVDRIPAHLLT